MCVWGGGEGKSQIFYLVLNVNSNEQKYSGHEVASLTIYISIMYFEILSLLNRYCSGSFHQYASF